MSNAEQEWFRSLAEVATAERHLVGDKALHLARLAQQGLPVPPGGVVTTAFFRAFLRETDLYGTWRELGEQGPQAAVRWSAFGERLRQTPFPPILTAALRAQVAAEPLVGAQWLAVRSSAVGEDEVGHSFAGLHRTLLGVAPEGVEMAVRECWASAFTPAAWAYRQFHGCLGPQVETAVLLQPLIGAVAAGVAWTVSPFPSPEEELVVSATWGLGLPLLRGEVEPDFYWVGKVPDWPVRGRQLGSKAERLRLERGKLCRTANQPFERERWVLSDERVAELAALLIQVESLLGRPQVVEWAHDGWEFLLLQARPLTAADAVPRNPFSSPPDAGRRETGQTGRWEGLCVSPGVAEGTAVVLHRPGEVSSLPPQFILVVPTPDPAWTPLLVRARGWVVETGGPQAHGAILAREFNLPTVAALPGITCHLRPGDRVRVDGNRGLVEKLTRSS